MSGDHFHHQIKLAVFPIKSLAEFPFEPKKHGHRSEERLTIRAVVTNQPSGVLWGGVKRLTIRAVVTNPPSGVLGRAVKRVTIRAVVTNQPSGVLGGQSSV